jgi:mRNA-degrading endonuclease YafQ of YafQ-DinJ toxin-antitoxin module
MKISELLNPKTIVESIVNQHLQGKWWTLAEAKFVQPAQKRQIILRTGSDFANTYGKIAKIPSAITKFETFKNMKSNPATLTTHLGSSDKLFTPDSPLGRSVPSLRHIHITHDISLVYRIHGSNPTYVDLYGFYTHDDLGSAPGGGNKPRTLTRMAGHFRDEVFR